MFGKSICVVALLLLCVALPVHADTVNVVGAGALPGTAADLTAINVTEITGSITIPDPMDTLSGVEMFKLNISDYLDFSAISNGLPFGIADTELFLFDSTGAGVYGNDDQGGSDPVAYTLACLPSVVSNPCPSTRPSGVGPTSDGIYYLAITSSANGPLDGDFNEIFNILDSTDVVGPSSSVPIANWDGNAFTSPDTDLVNFDITVTGVSKTPEPGVLALLAIGLLCITLRKKQLMICDNSQSQINS
jgi:PEP-CTERM motif